MGYNPRYNTDVGWVRKSFVLPKVADMADAGGPLLTPASMAFTDTTLGGSIAINPPPQFSNWADNVVEGRGDSKSTGVGRYYYEAIDQNAVHLHLRAGFARFNSWTQFFVGDNSFFDADASYMARTGRASPAFFTRVGNVIGYIFTAPLQPIIFAGKAVKWFIGKNSSKYVTLKPAQPVYLSAANTMLNSLAVNLGIIAPVFSKRDNEAGGSPYDGSTLEDQAGPGTASKSDNEKLHSLAPDIFRSDGGIDIYNVINKAQRLADQHHKKIREDLENMPAGSDPGSVAARRETMLKYFGGTETKFVKEGKHPNRLSSTKVHALDQYVNAYFSSKEGYVEDPKPDKDSKKALMDTGANVESWPQPEEEESWSDAVGDYLSQFAENLDANLGDGSEFITFDVRSRDSVSESFTNSYQESSIKQTIDGMSSSGRDRNFNFMGGNIGEGLFASMIEGSIGAVTNLVKGAIDTVGMSGLAVLNGAAFVDIPKQYSDSTATLPTMSYSLKLRSPYGHPMARFMYEIVPMVMLLAMALPKSTGRQSYAEPFYLEAFCQGRVQSRFAAINQLTIKRGTSNLPFGRNGVANGIDIDFSIVDLSSVMHMPLVNSTQVFDDENALTDYLATVGALSLTDQIYQWRRFNLNLTRKLAQEKSSLSAGAVASSVASSFPATLLQATKRGIFYD
jgi:hypothetical protein